MGPHKSGCWPWKKNRGLRCAVFESSQEVLLSIYRNVIFRVKLCFNSKAVIFLSKLFMIVNVLIVTYVCYVFSVFVKDTNLFKSFILMYFLSLLTNFIFYLPNQI